MIYLFDIKLLNNLNYIKYYLLNKIRLLIISLNKYKMMIFQISGLGDSQDISNLQTGQNLLLLSHFSIQDE